MLSNLSEQEKYRANVAQADYDKQGKNKERSLKIGKDKDLENYIRNKMFKDKFSGNEIIGEVKKMGLVFKDLTYLPLQDRDEFLRNIEKAIDG